VTVGIIGYGRFGKLVGKFIARRVKVRVYDPRIPPRKLLSRRIWSASLQEAASQSIVILAVPISALQQTLHSIAPFLRSSALIIDVCSVKVRPIRWMKRILPKEVRILGTHPLFGPDSAPGSIKGHRIFICPVRISEEELRHVIRQLRQEKLVVTVISPDEHDRIMAETLFLTQYVGRLLRKTGLRGHEVSTKSYDELMRIVRIADNDSRELFRDMLLHNRYAQHTLKHLMRAQERVLKELS
jgi:prephenate dehydrogenase